MLLETDFSEIGSWPEKIDVASGTAVQLTDDGYELSSTSASYVWSFTEAEYGDVVLETAVLTGLSILFVALALWQFQRRLAK